MKRVQKILYSILSKLCICDAWKIHIYMHLYAYFWEMSQNALISRSIWQFIMLKQNYHVHFRYVCTCAEVLRRINLIIRNCSCIYHFILVWCFFLFQKNIIILIFVVIIFSWTLNVAWWNTYPHNGFGH